MKSRLTARAKKRLVRSWTVLLSFGAVYGLVLAFQAGGYDPLARGGNAFDNWLLVCMGAAYAMTAIVMLIWNEEWPLRAHGQLMTYAGDALYFGFLGLWRVGLRHAFTKGELTWIRALFVVGVSCLTVGLLLLGWRKWRARENARRAALVPREAL